MLHPRLTAILHSTTPQVRDAIYAAIRLPLVDRHIRHEKHWKYVSNHTVQFWAKVRNMKQFCLPGNQCSTSNHAMQFWAKVRREEGKGGLGVAGRLLACLTGHTCMSARGLQTMHPLGTQT